MYGLCSVPSPVINTNNLRSAQLRMQIIYQQKIMLRVNKKRNRKRTNLIRNVQLLSNYSVKCLWQWQCNVSGNIFGCDDAAVAILTLHGHFDVPKIG